MADNSKEPLPSIEELEKRINKASGQEEPPQEQAGSMAAGAMRISIELVAGIIVGCLLGYYLDKWLGTKPVFFLVCFFFGLAAGAYNVYRLVKRL